MPLSVVVMGVSGCGKSVVGAPLAKALGAQFIEGDDFHPSENVARMAAGVALTDADREGWLETLCAQLAQAGREGRPVVLACSALKRGYRDTLRRGAPGLRVVYLTGEPALLAKRLAARQGHYMPVSLLDSQLAALEAPQADEAAITLDIRSEPAALVSAALTQLNVPAPARLSPGAPPP